MTWDDDDDLVDRFRGLLLEQPDRALDQKILRAAGRARIRNSLLPIALAMAASLALVWGIHWREASPAVSYHRAAQSEVVPGLYEGHVSEELADPAMTKQSIYAQMPGGSEGEVNHGS